MEEEALPEELGVLVRQLRLSRGLSQEAFAEACGIERAYMSSIERGRVNVSVRTAFRLARGLDLTLAGLFGMLERRGGAGDPGG